MYKVRCTTRINLSRTTFRWTGAAALGLLLGAALPASLAAQVAITGRTSNTPIHIQAEELQVDMDAGTAEFCGNVLATQDDAQLSADRLTIHYTRTAKNTPPLSGDLSSSSITKLAANGQVVIRQETSTATAEAAVYETASDRIVLSGRDAVVSSADATLRGERISYSKTGGQLTVESRPPQRVKLTLRPTPSQR